MNAQQLDLYSTVSVRGTDPDTSREAAVRDRTVLRCRVAAVLAAHPAGLTDWELTRLLEEPDHRKPTIGKRRQEVGCVDTGLRRPSPQGSPCVVWALAS